jgi:hypothetical protein
MESVIQWLSNEKSLSVARSRMTRLTNGEADRSRQFQPGCLGTYGSIEHIGHSRGWMNRSHLDSGVRRNTAWAMARQKSPSTAVGGHPAGISDLVVALHVQLR